MDDRGYMSHCSLDAESSRVDAGMVPAEASVSSGAIFPGEGENSAIRCPRLPYAQKSSQRRVAPLRTSHQRPVEKKEEST